MQMALVGLAELRFKILYRMQYIPLFTVFAVSVGVEVVSMLFIRSLVITFFYNYKLCRF